MQSQFPYFWPRFVTGNSRGALLEKECWPRLYRSNLRTINHERNILRVTKPEVNQPAWVYRDTVHPLSLLPAKFVSNAVFLTATHSKYQQNAECSVYAISGEVP
jgi:hypothetical protein